MSELGELTITALGAAFRAQRLSPAEVTQHCLDRIARLHPELHAFITVTADTALAQAHASTAPPTRAAAPSRLSSTLVRSSTSTTMRTR